MDKIICVGKNYLEHAKELGDSIPEIPVFFLKPPSSALFIENQKSTTRIPLPRDRGSIHPECEIILQLDKEGEINKVALGLDMTLRDVQTSLKKKGHPWEISKVFPSSAVIGPWIPYSEFQDYLEHPFSLSIENQVRQNSHGREMRFSPVECLKYARDYFPLCEGDILFTGTPAGVAGVTPGQKGEIRWSDRYSFKIEFV